MNRQEQIDGQLEFDKRYYLNHLDFKDWIRYYFVFKGILKHNCQSVIEMGSGGGCLTDLIKPNVDKFTMLDFNPKLKPDICCDVREFQENMIDKYDCIVALEILEHVPFEDLDKILDNFYWYLNPFGKLFITVPHRNPFVSFISVLNTWYPFTFVITKLIRVPPRYFFKKISIKNLIDPFHEWEVGYNGIKTKDVENRFIGFKILEYKNIPYHDYWVLEKI